MSNKNDDVDVDVELFLSLLKEYPFLFDSKSSLLKNQLFKNEYWQMIGKRVGLLTFNEYQIQFNSIKAKLQIKKKITCSVQLDPVQLKENILNDSVSMAPRR